MSNQGTIDWVLYLYLYWDGKTNTINQQNLLWILKFLDVRLEIIKCVNNPNYQPQKTQMSQPSKWINKIPNIELNTIIWFLKGIPAIINMLPIDQQISQNYKDELKYRLFCGIANVTTALYLP